MERIKVDQGMITRKCAELVRLRQRHHNLKMRWPCGLRSIDDGNDSKRDYLQSQIETMELEIALMRLEVSK
jgi:hypothetical protein